MNQHNEILKRKRIQKDFRIAKEIAVRGGNRDERAWAAHFARTIPAISTYLK